MIMPVPSRLNDPIFLQDFRQIFKTASIVGIGLIAGLALDLAVVEFVRSRFRPFLGFLSGAMPAGTRPVVRYGFFAAAVVCVVLVRFLHGRMLRQAADVDDPMRALRILSRNNMIILALSETPALLGLALFLLAGYNRDFYLLLFVSLFLFFMYFPRLKSWEDTLQKNPSACPR